MSLNHVAELLIRHGRMSAGHCVCGWRDPHRVHADHVTDELAGAGLILTPEREREIRIDEREKRADIIRPFDRGAAAAVLFLAEPRPLTEQEIARGREIARLIAEEVTP